MLPEPTGLSNRLSRDRYASCSPLACRSPTNLEPAEIGSFQVCFFNFDCCCSTGYIFVVVVPIVYFCLLVPIFVVMLSFLITFYSLSNSCCTFVIVPILLVKFLFLLFLGMWKPSISKPLPSCISNTSSYPTHQNKRSIASTSLIFPIVVLAINPIVDL